MSYLRSFILLLPAAAAFCLAAPAQAQTPVPLDNPASASVQALDLGDPFFKLVISASPQPTRLADVEAALQPNAAQRQRFVVDESIKSSAPGVRRSVVSFRGNTTGPTGETVVVDSNVMLSVFFSPGTFPQTENGTEALGWDEERGRYNYYKLNGTSWRFHGTSSGDEVPNRTGCMSCHHNGTPIMKELLVPWANWTSISDTIAYLTQPPWNPASSPIFSPGNPVGAEQLELQILSALRRFHRHAIAKAQTPAGGGVARIDTARELLRPIFEITELNIASSMVPTGNLHPFTTSTMGILQEVPIPNTHFLNARVFATSNLPGSSAKGTLEIAAARQFQDKARVPAIEYDRLVQANALRLASCSGPVPGLAGDAHFAWLHPEPGLFDVTRIELLLTEDIVDQDFVAAAMAVDFRNPLSPARAALLEFVPDSFEADANGPRDLHQQVLAALDAATSPLSPEAGLFRDRLRSGQARALLEQDVEAYLAEVETAFANPGTSAFEQELDRQFDTLLTRRMAMLTDPDLCNLIEGPVLPVRGN